MTWTDEELAMFREELLKIAGVTEVGFAQDENDLTVTLRIPTREPPQRSFSLGHPFISIEMEPTVERG